MAGTMADTILVVDDDPTLRMMLETILHKDGLDVVTANDGIDAQTAVRTPGKEIGAIVLDWSMPRMSGIDFLRWIKDQTSLEHIPVIMHTVLTDPERVKEGIDAGAYYYLPKPATREVIHSIIRSALTDYREKKRLLEKLRESENPFRFLSEGIFRFQTIAEGEFLGLRIAHACPNPERAALIMEMIVNAVEHGNVGITYSEKGKFMEEGTWHAEIERRVRLPEHAGKFVELRMKRYPDKMTVLIEDQGIGFDFARYFNLDESRLLDNHGRGIAMARAYLDLQYLGSGNKVLVTIPFDES